VGLRLVTNPKKNFTKVVTSLKFFSEVFSRIRVGDPFRAEFRTTEPYLISNNADQP
jgi:hypothetical protein